MTCTHVRTTVTGRRTAVGVGVGVGAGVATDGVPGVASR